MKTHASIIKQVFHKSPDPIWILCTKSKKILEVNKAVLDIYGFTTNDVISIKTSDVFSNDKTIIKEDFFKHNKDGERLSYDIDTYVDDKENKVIVYCKRCKIPFEDVALGKFSNIAQEVVDLGFWEVDLINNKVFWSDKVYELHETTKEEHTPTLRNGIEFYREDFRDSVANAVQNLLDNGEDFKVEAVLVTKKNNEKWIRTTGTAEYLNEKPIKIYGSIVDIDDLKQSENSYAILANNLPGVVFEYYIYPDQSDGIGNVSEGSKEIWGFQPERVNDKLPEIWERTYLGGDAEYLKHTISESVNNMKQWTAVWRYVHPDGSLRTLRGYGFPNKLISGEVKFNSLILDVTEESKTKELLQQATHVAQIGSWEYDLFSSETGTLICDKNTEIILETDKDKIPLNESFINFTSQDGAKEFMNHISELIKNDIPLDKEILITTPSNKKKWIRVIGVSERANARCLKIFGSIQDITKSKNLEAQIKDIITSINDAFYALDEDQQFIYVNEAAIKLLGKTEEEVLGKNIWDLYPEEVYANVKKQFISVLKTGKNARFEFYDKKTKTWYEIYAYKSDSGLSAYYRDISEKKLALLNLKKSVKDKNEILESIGDAFFTLDKKWTITYWNKQAEIFTGYLQKEVLGKYFWDFYKEDLNTKFHRKFEEAMKTEKNVFFEDFNSQRKRWFDLRLYGSKSGISAYISDITTKKSASLLLEESNRLFEKVTQATNDAIWEWNLEQNKVRRSNQFIERFGHDVKPLFYDLSGWKDLIYPNEYKFISKKIKQILEDKTKTRWTLDYTIRTKNKKLIHLLDRGIIERGKGGKVLELVGAITDLTKQKKLEKDLLKLNDELKQYSNKLEKSNKELEQFAFVTSHDLQEPLRMISSFLDLFRKKYGDQLDSKGKKYIYYANDAAKRMKNIIVDLLKYSRVTNVDAPKEDVDLNVIIKDFKTLRAKRIEDTNASIISKELPIINSYKAILVQIFHALLDNALKYSKEDFPPLIDIYSEDKGTYWLFTIQDNGIGIAPEFYDKIFLLFQRLHNNNMYSGTGIGLTYVKRSVEFLGGKIWLESEENKGTKFFFTVKK